MTKKVVALAVTASLLASISGCSAKNSTTSTSLDPDNPVTVTIWTYYNADQLASFEALTEEFNTTVGAEKGVVVTSISQGDVDTLADELLDSVADKAGSQETPTLASIYPETAFILEQSDALASFDSYFTEEELAAYVPGFIEEGRFNAKNELLQFPILKSTEIFAANKTDWQAFTDATGITLESLQTKEDLTAAGKAYYEWTDAQTPDVPEDGKALYGRDSVANYILLGCYELGHEFGKIENGTLTIDLDRDTFKTLWDNYYIPYINGYFGKYGKFSSDDAKTGKVLSLTSSSSGVTFLPTAVTGADDQTHEIEIYEMRDLNFKDAVVDASIQQGAGFSMMKCTEAQQQGATEFLKWASKPERNIAFALESGYSPVTIEANNAEAITEAYTGDTASSTGQNILNALLISADTFENSTTYAMKPFEGCRDLRFLLGDALQNTAEADRAAVEEAIASGSSRADAVADYSTDAYFDQWFAKLCNDVEAITNK